MRAKLYCKTGLLAGAKYEFSQGVSIGRSSANSIVLEPPLISEVHARIFYDAGAGCYILEDMGSRNGTFLDGMRVARPERLGALHVITLAQKYDFIFQIVAVNSPRAARPQPAPETSGRAANRELPPPAEEFVHDPAEEKRIFSGPVWKPSPIRGKKNANPKPERRPTVVRKPTNGKTLIEDLLKQASKPPETFTEKNNALTMVEALGAERPRPAQAAALCLETGGNGAKQVFALKEGENVLGRSPLCQICIDDPSISRKHAILHVASGKVYVKDLGSRNHTYVQGATVVAEMEVGPQTTLRFGTVEAKLVEQ